MRRPVVDLLVIGGGINGCGIAADAAGRGLSVCLVEMGDLAGGTSSASSKLIHGGLRYLEHWEFRLVREALSEREVLLERAPHIIWPLRFVLPHAPGMRPRGLIRAGLFLYDHLARRRRIPASRALDLRHEPAGRLLKPEFATGYAYWDCWVDDARLVVLNARLAADRGAEIRTRTRVTALARVDGVWRADVIAGDRSETIHARTVVNAAGPWAGRLLSQTGVAPSGGRKGQMRLVKGSHIVVPKISELGDALILQHPDGRVVFVLPFEDDFTLIGTTDVAIDGDPARAACSPEETAYLIQAVNRFLAVPLTASDIVWTFAGVRPLHGAESAADPSVVSRDYHLERSHPGDGAALVSVIGGKVTTYRRLAEEVLDLLRPEFPAMRGPWTAGTPLPGGDIPEADFAAFEKSFAAQVPWLPPALRHALARRHGTRVRDVVGDAGRLEDLGEVIAHDVTAREVLFLIDDEWAQSPDDILWRRTKAGLHLGTDAARDAAVARLADFF